MPKKPLKATSVKFDSDTAKLLKKLVKHFGVNQTSVVIMSVRKLASVEGLG